MQELFELIRIANPTKLKNIQPLGKVDTLADTLYSLIQKGEVQSDEDALRHLYSDTKSKVALYQVKEKLFNKLVDTILIIDPNSKNVSPYSIAHHDCLKFCAAFEKITLKGGKKSVLKLGEKTLKLALAYNMSDIIVRISKVLMRKAVYLLKDEKKLNFYRKLYVKYIAIEQLDELSNYYWLNISLRTSQKRMIADDALIEQANQYIKELESKLLPDHTAATFLNIQGLKLRIEELKHNHEKVVELVDEYLIGLKNYKDVHANYFTVGLNMKMSALITLRRYREAEKVAQKTFKTTREGYSSWFTALENLLILHFYQSKYAEALKVYQQGSTNKGFKLLPKSRQEIFNVYRAYIQFFMNVGLLSTQEAGRGYKTYRSAKFSNEVPIFSKDKIGVNITIKVAQFILLFTEGKYKEANKKIESLRQYAHSHLRKGVTYRANCFMKMLIKLIECSYHKDATIRKTKDNLEKLKNIPPEAQRQTSHVEIVPYETLWEIIMDRIDNSSLYKFKKKPKIAKASKV